MALCSLIFMPVLLLVSALLLADGQTTTSQSYVVAIHKSSAGSKTAVCTGAIIKPRDILTTASCVDRAGEDIFVSASAHDTNQAASVGDDFYEAHKVFKHPDFNRKTNMIDLAIIKLKSDIQAITDIVGPLLVTNVAPMNATNCTATHWRTQSPYTQPIRTGKPTPCADADKPTQVCAKFTEYEACNETDAEGSVLTCNGKIVGIFSGKVGNKNCTKKLVRFVDVTKHFNWINSPEPLMPAYSGAQKHYAYHVAILTVLSALIIRV